MSAIAAPPRYTPEDLLTMPDGDRFELVNGELVERSKSILASYVAGEIFSEIAKYARHDALGLAFPGGLTLQCFPAAPDNVRKVDVSYFRSERMSFADLSQPGHCRIAPDLAVEVISPTDLVYAIDEKVHDFLHAGVLSVWVVNPKVRTVRIYRADGSLIVLRATDEIKGEAALPDFRCKVDSFFDLLTDIPLITDANQ